MPRLLQSALQYSSYVFPRFAAERALDLFLTPPKHSPPSHELEWKNAADHQWVDSRLRVYRWGNAQHPQILLVHGWAGRGTQLAAFAAPLVNAGFSVIAMDGTAHGESLGKQTNAGEFTRDILTVQKSFGKFHTVIGHSFGAGCLTLAASLGLESQNLVLIACPDDYARIIDFYLDFLQFSDRASQHFLQSLIQKAQLDSQKLKVGQLGSTLSQRALLIHDRGDKEVGFESALEIHKDWRQAELFETTGLGHRRILKSPEVIDQVLRFIQVSNQQS